MEQIELEALAAEILKLQEAHRHTRGKKHFHFRMAFAVALGLGIFAVYRVLHVEEAFKGLEYVLPAVVDKLLFGLGE